MWKPYAGSIFDFMDKKILLLIFRTSFSKNWPFLLLFSNILILTKSIKGIAKLLPNYNQYDILNIFCHYLWVHLVKIRFFEKKSKNGQFLLNEVLKISNKNFLSIKSKMLPAQGFHINFQFRPKSDSHGTWGCSGPPGSRKRPRALQDGPIFYFFVSNGSL